MSLSYSESMCQNCIRLAQEALKRGDLATYVKYGSAGTYKKESESNDGFSYKKAALGTIVFGAVGAVAGINGKKTVTYKCDRCGHTITKTE